MQQQMKELREVRARDPQPQPEDTLRRIFAPVIAPSDTVDARFVAGQKVVIGASGMAKRAPIVAALLGDPNIYRFLTRLWQRNQAVLIKRMAGSGVSTWYGRPAATVGSIVLGGGAPWNNVQGGGTRSDGITSS